MRRGPDITDDNAPDLGGTGHTALNFTGGAGLVSLLNYAPSEGGKGLAVTLYDQGKSDALQLATIDPATA